MVDMSQLSALCAGYCARSKERFVASRRQFLKLGLMGGTVLLVARWAYGPFRLGRDEQKDDAEDYSVLTARDREVLRVIVPVVLEGALDQEGLDRSAGLAQVVHGVDAAVAALPPPVQEEVAQLFRLLEFPPARRFLAGVAAPWSEASREDVATFLERWRTHRWALLRAAERALHELITAAWYANPASWDRIGYAAPVPPR